MGLLLLLLKHELRFLRPRRALAMRVFAQRARAFASSSHVLQCIGDFARKVLVRFLALDRRQLLERLRSGLVNASDGTRTRGLSCPLRRCERRNASKFLTAVWTAFILRGTTRLHRGKNLVEHLSSACSLSRSE